MGGGGGGRRGPRPDGDGGHRPNSQGGRDVGRGPRGPDNRQAYAHHLSLDHRGGKQPLGWGLVEPLHALRSVSDAFGDTSVTEVTCMIDCLSAWRMRCLTHKKRVEVPYQHTKLNRFALRVRKHSPSS